MKKILSFFIAVFLVIGSVSSQSNFWYGNLEFGGMGMIITLESDNVITAGGVKAWFGSPMQTPMKFDVVDIDVEGDDISFSVPSLKVEFDGNINGATGNLVGKFKQNGANLDLTLMKTDKPFTVNRPQQPVPPFPYDVREVNVVSADGVSLSATITSPKLAKGKKCPAVVLVAGSGPNDRNESVFMHKPFEVIADYLTRNGYIVIRYDKRGVGKSTGSYAVATTYDFADDANAVFEYLRTVEGVDTKKVGIVGHSEGGIIAPMVAQKNPNVNYIILLAAPSIPSYDIVLRQNKDFYVRAETPYNVQENAMMVVSRSLGLLADGKSGSEFQDEVVQAIEICKQSLTAEEFELTGFPADKVGQVSFAKKFESVWFETFIKLKPIEFLKGLKIPVMAIYGQFDVQVYWEQNFPVMNEVLVENGNKYSKTVKLDGVNHLFQPCSNGAVYLYGVIEETTSAKLLNELNLWLSTISKVNKLVGK